METAPPASGLQAECMLLYKRKLCPTRVDRLLWERELKKSRIFSHGAEAEAESSSSSNTGRSGDTGLPEHGERAFNGGQELRLASEEVVPDESMAVTTVGEQQEGTRVDLPHKKRRLLMVSNRLHVTAVRNADGSWKMTKSSGGLSSAFRGLGSYEIIWIGWPGVNVSDEIERKKLTEVLAKERCVPVFLDEELYQKYYVGYCNTILWSLFHYLGLPNEDKLETNRRFESQLVAYRQANEMFAKVVLGHYKEGDFVWCHDYHLMLLPQLLKEHRSEIIVELRAGRELAEDLPETLSGAPLGLDLGFSAGSKRKKSGNGCGDPPQKTVAWYDDPSKLDLKSENYFSCTIGWKRSHAKYALDSAAEVASFLKELVEASKAVHDTLATDDA